ncbi:MAG: AAA family ATPase [Candidatus Aminicenantes bacterium]|nr:AAA family ATPase [Candidatus Aminicenantes bacterium]
MFKISGYSFSEKLYENAHIVIYRGKRNRDSLPVIAKSLKAPYPTPEELSRLEHEFDIGSSMDLPGVVAYLAIENVGYGKSIIMEDFGAISLARYIRSHRVDIRNSLRIIKATVNIIGDIHHSNVIHKDINPYNILINPETKEVKVTDFSISTFLKREAQDALEPEVLKGTLSYISPEQTGRMNRSIDYRTDFYSLGVTAYEMLTGKRPFELDDPMELVHAHMARIAVQPHEINNAIPLTLSIIVTKLLAKNAEDRYQSSAGLSADLEECYDQLQVKGIIEDFSIGEKDISDKFLVPEKLYGREKETRHLMKLSDRVAEGGKIMALFSGPAGIGKSALVNEIHKPAAAKRAFFIGGKYSQFERHVPNSAVIQAFSTLMMQLLTEQSAQLEQWKTKILDAVGNNGQVIINVLPRVELIIGKQPETNELPPLETENRLNTVFREFIKVFAGKEHPLVLFFDDLQWADEASLRLIDALFADPDLKYFFLVGAFRDEEIDDSHPLTRLISEWQKTARGYKPGSRYSAVRLGGLNTKIIARLLADTLHCTEKKTKALAELVNSKTMGNPFFIHEFLKKLRADNLIEFKEGWTWDIARVQEAGITDNVAELMTGKLKRQPSDTLSAIKIAACEGVKFSLPLVADVAGKPVDNIFNDLKPAIDEGILLKTGDDCKFSHNKVQEAAYLLIGEKERKELHLKIGRRMWQEPEEEADETYLFSLAFHLNEAREFLNEEERSRLARVNLKAGRKSKAAIAYNMTFRFFKQGIKILPETSKWEGNYELALALYIEGAEAGYLAGEKGAAEKFFITALKNARSVLDKSRLYEMKLHVCMGLQQFAEALQLGRKALNILGLRLPRKASKLKILTEFIAVNLRLKTKRGGVAALSRLPDLTDPVKLATARNLISLMEPAFTADTEYFFLLVLKLLNLTLKYGNCEYSAFAYAVYGGVSCDFLGNIEQGYRLGNLALNMLEKYEAGGLAANVYYVYGAGIHHWKKHLRGDLAYLEKSIKNGTETGNLKYASYSIDNYIIKLFYAGEPLSEVKKECARLYPMVKRFHQVGAVQTTELWHRMVLNLLGEVEDKGFLTGEIFEEISFVSEWTAVNDVIRLGIFTMVKMMLLFYGGHFDRVIELAEKEKKYVESLIGGIHIKIFYYLYSLALLAHYPQADRAKQRRYLKLLKSHQKKMKKWAAHAPENLQHKYLLVEAGRHWLRGKVGEAVTLFYQAVTLARENRFIQEEAIACEFTARFYSALGIEEVALNYTRKAHYLYDVWDAKAKVNDLEAKYPQLVEISQRRKGTASTGSSSESTAPSLNLNAVMKASQIISGEIVMEKLLAKLIKILMENAGAQKIILFLKKDDSLLVEAEGKTEEQEISVFQRTPVEECELPQTIIRFVERTREFIVLDDSSRESVFSPDPYIRDQPPMSLLCMPLVHQDILIGILYLENKLSLNVFTAEQQETLKVLAAQAAVSLQNAVLYENLTRAEEKVRTILNTTNEGFLELDGNGIITGINPGMCAISGRNREDLVGTGFFQLLSPGDRELALQKFRIHNLDKSSSYKLNMVKPDRTIVQCLINATPLFDKNGNKLGSFAMVTDLTEYEKKERQLRQAQKMETVGTLAGGLAHDFNNILGGITGSLSLLQMETKKKGSDPEEIEKYLDDMVEAAGRATDIVKQLLALSRKEKLSFEPVDLNTTLRHVMTICRNTFEKSIDLNPVYYDDPAVVLADSTQLEQILLNLCVNAAHAMTIMKKKGQRWGGTLAVLIEKKYVGPDSYQAHQEAEEGYYWKVSVQDDGVGMDSETVAKIFEPFFTTKVKGQGTGLGLSMVYNIVKQHRGFMDVVSDPGKGSTFTVYLPQYREMLGPKRKRKEEEITTGEGLVLVIDDEPIMRKIAIKIMEKAGYNVVFAENGEEGVALFKKHHRDLKLALLDMQMPKKSGRETYIEMREINPAVKVLLASGFQRDERVEAILRLGVDGFIEKPYTFDQLVKAVQKIIDTP